MKYAIMVVWSDGSDEYVKEGSRIASFPSRARAKEQVSFMKIGMDGDEDVQSISIVRFPSGAPAGPGDPTK
jgi:hypothetical protein